MSPLPRLAGWIAAGALLLIIPIGAAASSAAESSDQPSAVAVAGDFDSEIGCPGDWAPDCDQAQMAQRTNDGIWQLTVTLPEGNYSYKAALNKSWDVNYGLHAAPGGGNIPLTIPAGGATVSFLYDNATHWITDTVAEPIATAAGDFQSELGCPSDWSPDCLRSWLEDPDGDGTYTFTTTAIPPGSYQVKATIGMSWAVNYGEDGAAGGPNIPFTVDTAGESTTFSFDAVSHVLTVYAGQARPSLQIEKAHWLTSDVIAWNLGADPASHTYQLVAAPDGGLSVDANGISGGTVIPLTYDPAGMPAGVDGEVPVPRQPRRPADPLGVGREGCRPAARPGRRRRTRFVAAISATPPALQIPGVLDALYGASAAHAALGPVFHSGKPTLSVWAPTAQTVSVELYSTAASTTSTLVTMRPDDTTGVWSVTGDKSWKGMFYRYQVKVFAPTEQKVVTNSVTDPYSLALSTDSERSQIVDLDDHGLAPRGWADSRSPAAIPSTQQEIQELHIGDFSAEDSTVPAADRGTYLAFTDATSAGMKHLRELARSGVTTIHLMPTFDFGGIPENRSDQTQPPCDLASFPADSDQQQACIAQNQNTDDYNWGYNPLHYTVPEGSYATDPNGAARTLEFRRMVLAITRRRAASRS